MGYEYFASTMTPGIALLILSTTMRLGNVRMALTELGKLSALDLESSEGFDLFSKRANFLCKGLRLLNISLLVLIPGALGKLMFGSFAEEYQTLFLIFDVAFFCVLFLAVVYLYKESKLTAKSILAHTKEITLVKHL